MPSGNTKSPGFAASGGGTSPGSGSRPSGAAVTPGVGGKPSGAAVTPGDEGVVRSGVNGAAPCPADFMTQPSKSAAEAALAGPGGLPSLGGDRLVIPGPAMIRSVGARDSGGSCAGMFGAASAARSGAVAGAPELRRPRSVSRSRCHLVCGLDVAERGSPERGEFSSVALSCAGATSTVATRLTAIMMTQDRAAKHRQIIPLTPGD
jgi:hypothetical protein